MYYFTLTQPSFMQAKQDKAKRMLTFKPGAGCFTIKRALQASGRRFILRVSAMAASSPCSPPSSEFARAA